MHRLSLLVIAALLGACAGEPLPNSAADQRARQAALEKARKAIAERRWPLPPDHKVAVTRSTFIPELREPWDVYTITFMRPRLNKSAAPLYSVTVRCDSGEVTRVDDERKNVQDEEIAAARRVFERKFGLTRKDYTLLAAPEDRTVEVTFMFDKAPRIPGRVTPQRTIIVVVDRATLKIKSLKESNEQPKA